MDHKKRLRFFYRKKNQEKDHSGKQNLLLKASHGSISPIFNSPDSCQPDLDSHLPLVGAFQPFKGEPSLLDFYRENPALQFVFPVASETGEMSFYKPAKSKAWRNHPFGFREPDPETAELVRPSQHISLFLVPGLAFDRKGRRLGRGKAFMIDFCFKKNF